MFVYVVVLSSKGINYIICEIIVDWEFLISEFKVLQFLHFLSNRLNISFHLKICRGALYLIISSLFIHKQYMYCSKKILTGQQIGEPHLLQPMRVWFLNLEIIDS